MTPQEAAKVLAKAAAYDNRQPNEAAALAWSEARAARAIESTPRERRELPSAPPPAEWQAMLNAAMPRKAI